MSYEDFMSRVNHYVQRKIGVHTDDLPDMLWYDFYEDHKDLVGENLDEAIRDFLIEGQDDDSLTNLLEEEGE